ncbi:MAG: tetratricopeptide repeat protein [Candidatus Eisenbacteria bacterium]|nr:tetratricopeptide repeat protein [Candidatus Eisenbacteria bacterium]
MKARRSADSGGWGKVFAAAAFAALLLFAARVSAADPPDRNDDARYQRQMEEAGRLLRRADAERAARIYADLLEQRPGNRDAFIGFVRARIAAYQLEGLEDGVKARSALSPEDAEIALLLGDVRSAAGDPSGAVAAWRAALPLFENPEDGYRELARRMSERRMLIDAIAILREGRAALAGGYLFAAELAYLYDLTGDGPAAARECVRAVATDAMKGAEGLRRLRELRGNGLVARYPIDTMRALLDSIPSRAALREVLAACYMDEGACGPALAEYEELERAQPRCGAYLLSFARGAVKGECYEEAARALDATVNRCDRPSTLLEALFLLGRVQRSMGSPEKAVGTYERIAGETRNAREARRARFEQAAVYAEDLGEPERAVPILQALLEGAEPGEGETEIRFALAGAHRLSGGFAGALAEYEALERLGGSDEIRERAIFEKGRTLFLSGDFEGALVEYRRVIDLYPLGAYLNDAIEASIFIGDNRDAGDGPLRAYAECLLLMENRRYEEARTRIEEMLGTLLLSNLRDELTWQLARIEEEEGRYRDAIRILEELIGEYPEARLAHRARMRIGDILAERLGDLTAGVAQYERFLVDYPNSILAEEVRRKRAKAEGRNEI